jgi:hypothetical protein
MPEPYCDKVTQLEAKIEVLEAHIKAMEKHREEFRQELVQALASLPKLK